MARPRGEPTTQLNVRLPDDLIEAVRLKLKDPVRNKTKHGSVTEIISHLLYRWLDDRDSNDLTKL